MTHCLIPNEFPFRGPYLARMPDLSGISRAHTWPPPSVSVGMAAAAAREACRTKARPMMSRRTPSRLFHQEDRRANGDWAHTRARIGSGGHPSPQRAPQAGAPQADRSGAPEHRRTGQSTSTPCSSLRCLTYRNGFVPRGQGRLERASSGEEREVCSRGVWVRAWFCSSVAKLIMPRHNGHSSPRAHPTGSQSGSAAPVLTQVPSTRSRGLLNRLDLT